ncbi:kelch repeat-containing protein, partial [Bacteroides sp.]|uniref:kelch repeat-containing protein n=1 Tax=Bacteroides sp. TaxID=29523 RepID=UPI002613F03D
LTFFDSKSAASKVKSELNALTTTAITDMEYSGDGRYICLVDKNSGMYLFDTTDDDLYSSGNNLTSLPFAKAPDSMKPEYVVYSQETNSFIIDNVASFSSSVISLDCEEFAAKKYAAKIPDENIFQLAPENDSIVHVNAKKTDYIYVATSDKTSDFNIHCVDQYSGAINYDREITLPKEPYDIALTSMGEKLSVTYGDNLAKAETYNAITATRTFELSLTDNNYTVAALNEGYSKNQRGNTAFIRDSTVATVKTNNGYAFDFENTFKKQSESINMVSPWECKQIVGLNGGGFLALAGKPDGTSLIDWYGKNSVGSYTRNARWISGVTAKQYSKTLPEEMLNDTSATTSPDDSYIGHIIIYHLNKFTPGSKITRITFVSAYSGTIRYVTPVLLEDQGGGNYLVKDYGMGIAVNEIGEYEESITWKISGVIENENYYPGVWYGDPDPDPLNVNPGNAGVIKYNSTPTCGFYSDIGDPTKGDTDNTPISINRSVKRKSTNNRNYQIQFTAEENIKPAESFPPKFVQDLAISRDDRVLALVASDSVSQSVKFYDFAANNFSNETQLKGMVADYRMQSLDLTNSPVKPGLSHKETPGVKLKDAITSNEPAWTSIKDYPANYNELGVSDLRVGTDKRFFGYYSLYSLLGDYVGIKFFSTPKIDKTRFYVDQFLLDYINSTVASNQFKPYDYVSAQSYLLQFEQAASSQKGAIFFQTDSSKDLGSFNTTGSGYIAINNMDNGWNKIASESVTPFRFEPVYMGEEEIYPAGNYLYRKMLFGRDVASPTLFLFSNQRDTKALEIRRVPLNGATEKKDYSGLVMTDVAISEDGQNIFVSAAKDLRKINVAASLGDRERIASFSSPVTHLANKPFVRYKSTPASGTITDLVTVFPEARWGSNNTVIASGGIYIAGGTDSSGNALNKIYQYDVFANNLTLVATLSESLSKHSMATYDSDLYMFNGIKNVASISDSVFKYFPESKRSIKSVRGVVVTTDVATSGAILTPRGSPGVFDARKEGWITYSSEPDSIKKTLYWRDGDGPYSTEDSVLNAFDGNTSTHWRLFGDSTSEEYRHIRIEFDIPVKVTHFKVVSEISGSGQNKFSGCILRASNSISSLASPSGGTVLKNISSIDEDDSGVEYSVDPGTTDFYTCYRLSLLTNDYSKEGKFNEIVFKGDYSQTITTNLPDTGMHRTLDDNLAPVAVTNNAACTTPYGIMVAGGYAGSGLADSSSNPGTTTALIYWPHAIGGVYEETNDKLYGISRSVPSLPEPSVDNCMVWHKGKVYCFGGTKTSGTTEFHLPFIFDFEYNTWAKANSAILGVDKLKRRKAAAVSFGDEIFLFGGECSVTTFAVAWNTSTNVVREVFSA